MKKLIFLLLMACSCFITHAQVVTIPTVNKAEYPTRINKIGDVVAPKASATSWLIPEKMQAYYDGTKWNQVQGFIRDTASTRDSADHTFDVYTPVTSDVAGILELTVIARDTSNQQAAIGRKKITFANQAGTWTLLSTTEDVAIAKTSGYANVTWSVAMASNKLRLTYKGLLATKIYWEFQSRIIK